ncbi:hypothetical protein NO1_1484 [Candidatus Termititenax aidoneus]|uniref:PorV/PorQ family protein n=1 Tax=Termititenax aidoneus TaxID=2218524 RepID=A0A388TCR1_TERA1|nr:hypothetical protein NO1_1484 [Candidatus Termititenax aidoneus]
MIKRLAILFLLLGSLALADDVKQTDEAGSLAIGADAMGRGGAYYAAERSAQPLFQNYAFLGSRQQPRLAMSVFQLLNELNYLTVSAAFGNFAVGALNISDSSGYLRDAQNNLVGGQISYSDTTIYGAFGWGAENFGLGARLKYITKSYSGLDITAAGSGADAAGFVKFGLLTLGFSLNNIVNNGLLWSTGTQEIFIPEQGFGLKLQALDNFDIYADAVLLDGDTLARGGVEYRLLPAVALRAGMAQYADTTEDGVKTLAAKLTAGLGLELFGVGLDYAYNPSEDFSGNVAHYFTLAWRFGSPPQEEDKKTPPSPPKPKQPPAPAKAKIPDPPPEIKEPPVIEEQEPVEMIEVKKVMKKVKKVKKVKKIKSSASQPQQKI